MRSMRLLAMRTRMLSAGVLAAGVLIVCALAMSCPRAEPAPALSDDGAPCDLDEQCASDRCGAGVCRPPECGVDEDCADAEACFHHQDGEDDCEPAPKRGERCRYRSDVERGGFDATCTAGLECVVATTGGFVEESVCVPADGTRLLHEPCDAKHACADGLACNERGRCLVVLNGPCAENDDCLAQICHPAFLFCTANECSDVGQPCESEGDFCSGGPCGRVCEPLGARGDGCHTLSSDVAGEDPCPTTRRCADDLVCQVVQIPSQLGMCVPETNRAEGEACQDAAQCESGICDAAFCR